MRKVYLTLILIVLFLATSFYSKTPISSDKQNKQIVLKSLIGLNKLPKYYSPLLARKNRDIVGVHGITNNIGDLDKFIKNIYNHKLDMIRITTYTNEGDAIIEDLICDKGEIKLTIDNTRDNFSSKEDRKIKQYKVIKITKDDNRDGTFYTAELSKGNIPLIFDNKK